MGKASFGTVGVFRSPILCSGRHFLRVSGQLSKSVWGHCVHRVASAAGSIAYKGTRRLVHGLFGCLHLRQSVSARRRVRISEVQTKRFTKTRGRNAAVN